MRKFNLDEIRKEFHSLEHTKEGKPLVYLDSAATAFKPYQVAQAINNYDLKETATVHRGLYQLSELATTRYEATRELVKDFINSPSREEIIFTKGTTESINLVAQSLGQSFQEG
ncbi:MAG: aminotransferase class V-fold PLP-dependent enzyme, partial [Bacteriovoracia bacterium]